MLLLLLLRISFVILHDVLHDSCRALQCRDLLLSRSAAVRSAAPIILEHSNPPDRPGNLNDHQA